MTSNDVLKLALADLKRSGISRREALDVMKIEAMTSQQMIAVVKGPSPAAYALPYFTIDGAETAYKRYRFLASHVPRGGKKSRKYHQVSGESSRFYFPPLIDWRNVLADADQRLYIVEGEKKAVAVTKLGYPCIGIGGVYNWLSKEDDEGDSEAIADFSLVKWSGRQVGIIFDSDVTYKRGVLAALSALRDHLVARGANPFQVVLPDSGEKCGIDDFIVASGRTAKNAFETLQLRRLFMPQAFSGEDIKNVKERKVDWIVEGLIGRGVTLFAGAPKIGKSWLALGLLLAVSNGTPALGTFATRRVKTVYLALEDNPERIKKRIQLIERRVARLQPSAQFFFDWPLVEDGGLKALKYLLDQDPEIKFVLIDTLAKVRAPNTGRGSIYLEDYRALDALKQIADAKDVAFVIVHHYARRGLMTPSSGSRAQRVSPVLATR